MKLRSLSLTTLFTVLSLLVLLSAVRTDSAAQPPYGCDSANPATKSLPFCRADLPVGERAGDLVSRLTLDEKISQLVNSAPAIPRLGVPAYEWWSEALHGVADNGLGVKFVGAIPAATSFPQVILTAASFDDRLWYRIAQAIGTEARAVYNAGEAKGMTFWAPNINIFRDPRWGRGQETPGEDPAVAGKYAVAYVRGLQGDSYDGGNKLAGSLLASACCKHFTAYDLDNWNGINRFVFDAQVTQQDLADTYQPPFQSCIEKARASGIMCAYNRVNGVPNCADYNLLTKTARGLWNFQGYIVSDCDAVGIIYAAQRFAKSPEDAVADVLKAGMDVNCGSYLKNHTQKAVQENKVAVSEIDRALKNLFSVRMRLGLFDGNPAQYPFGKIGPDHVCSEAHQALALEAARNGIVLLKNAAKLLPLPKSIKPTLAIIGPNANSPRTLQGNYFGPPCKSVTPLQALGGYAQRTLHHQGCNAVNCTSADVAGAVEVAKGADYVVMVMGLDQTVESEDHDRDQLGLPGHQQHLITAVAAAAKRPVVLVILSGGPVDVSFAKKDSHVGSIVWAGYPGEAGGIAIAEIIFGDHNPGGRLPVTWYPQDFIKVPMTDMRMRPSSGYPGRTYRFYNGPKVFEFGYGLSYTTYSYKLSSDVQNKLYLGLASSPHTTLSSHSVRYHSVSALTQDFCANKAFSVHVGVENRGEVHGKDSVLLFSRRRVHKDGSPVKQLVGFQGMSLKAGEMASVEFSLNPCEHLSSANEDGLMVLEEASHVLFVGDQEYPVDVVF